MVSGPRTAMQEVSCACAAERSPTKQVGYSTEYYFKRAMPCTAVLLDYFAGPVRCWSSLVGFVCMSDLAPLYMVLLVAVDAT